MKQPWSELLEVEAAPVHAGFEQMPQGCLALFDAMVQHGWTWGG